MSVAANTRREYKLEWQRTKLAKDAAYREKRNAYNRAYYQSHKAGHVQRAKAYRENNRDKVNATSKRWRAAHPEKVRARNQIQKLQRYGLTPETYAEMLLAQENGCAICRKTFDLAKTKTIHIDHCHQSGIVRGLLCENCNHGLGKFKDEPATLRRAADYLDRHGKAG